VSDESYDLGGGQTAVPQDIPPHSNVVVQRCSNCQAAVAVTPTPLGDLCRTCNDHLMRATSGMPSPEAPPSRGLLRSKLFGALLIAGVGVGASIMSCVGQSFSLRQARALEGIEQQLTRIQLQQNCPGMEKR
jgi:hypothetical protein